MKIFRTFAFASLALCAACAQAPSKSVTALPPPPGAKQQVSVQRACQDPHIQCLDQTISIQLHLPDGKTYSQTLPSPNPLVQNDFIYIFPGQTLYIEADVDGDNLVNLHLVPGNTHPEKTLILKFEQGGADTEYMMSFDIHNPFDRMLKYHAGIMGLDTTTGMPQKTNTCPVIGKGGAFETWPEPVLELVLGNFRLLAPDSKEAGACIF